MEVKKILALLLSDVMLFALCACGEGSEGGEEDVFTAAIMLPGIRSETMLHFLSVRGVCVSAGSACSAHAKKTSNALTAFGVKPQDADSSLRISLSPYTTEADIDILISALADGLATLVRARR